MEVPTSAAAASTGGDVPPEKEVSSVKANGEEGDSGMLKPVLVILEAGRKGTVTDEVEIIRQRLVIDGDGTGDDKKLAKLTEMYLTFLNDDNPHDPADRLNIQNCYKTFKSLLKQTDGIRSCAAKTFHAVTANTNALIYWETIQQAITKEVAELKTFVVAQRQHAADIMRNRKQSQERDALVKLLNQVPERDVTEREVKKLQEEYGELLIRQTELDEQINNKKIYLSYLFELFKRLDSEDIEIVNEAVTEAEERVLSDVSMDLD